MARGRPLKAFDAPGTFEVVPNGLRVVTPASLEG